MIIDRECGENNTEIQKARKFIKEQYLKNSNTLNNFMLTYEDSNIIYHYGKHIVCIARTDVQVKNDSLKRLADEIEDYISDNKLEKDRRDLVVVLATAPKTVKQKNYGLGAPYKRVKKKLLPITATITGIVHCDVLFYTDLDHNVMKHEMAAKINVLSYDKKMELNKSNMYGIHQLSLIDLYDPQVEWLGCKVGDVLAYYIPNNGNNGGNECLEYKQVADTGGDDNDDAELEGYSVNDIVDVGDEDEGFE